MKILLNSLALLALLAFLVGCAYQNYKWIKVDGKEINTPYGRANANMYYESRMCFPKCEGLINAESTNSVL